MTLVDGIALAAIWGMPVAAILSPYVRGEGLALTFVVALIATLVIAL